MTLLIAQELDTCSSMPGNTWFLHRLLDRVDGQQKKGTYMLLWGGGGALPWMSKAQLCFTGSQKQTNIKLALRTMHQQIICEILIYFCHCYHWLLMDSYTPWHRKTEVTAVVPNLCSGESRHFPLFPLLAMAELCREVTKARQRSTFPWVPWDWPWNIRSYDHLKEIPVKNLHQGPSISSYATGCNVLLWFTFTTCSHHIFISTWQHQTLSINVTEPRKRNTPGFTMLLLMDPYSLFFLLL